VLNFSAGNGRGGCWRCASAAELETHSSKTTAAICAIMVVLALIAMSIARKK
jgi:hypothetical protein